MRDLERAKKWREENKEKLKQQSHERYLKRDKEKMKAYRKANPDKVKKWEENARRNNPEAIKKAVKKWHAKNPNYRSEYYRKNKEYHLKQNKIRIEQNKLFIKSFLTKCAECGTNEKLCFHHVDKSTKGFSIANNRGASIETLKKEIEKCVVLCKSCHAKLHDKETPMEKKIAKGKANIGRKNKPETIEKMKAAWARKKLAGYKQIGKPHSEETKKIISQKAKERWAKRNA